MSLKKTFQLLFGDKNKRMNIWYISSKIVFITMAYSFFQVYFFMSAGFYDSFFGPIFLPLYVGFVVSFITYLCLASWKFLSPKIPFYIIAFINIIWITLGVYFLFTIY